jgi:hypothetical protein
MRYISIENESSASPGLSGDIHGVCPDGQNRSSSWHSMDMEAVNGFSYPERRLIENDNLYI